MVFHKIKFESKMRHRCKLFLSLCRWLKLTVVLGYAITYREMSHMSGSFTLSLQGASRRTHQSRVGLSVQVFSRTSLNFLGTELQISDACYLMREGKSMRSLYLWHFQFKEVLPRTLSMSSNLLQSHNGHLHLTVLKIWFKCKHLWLVFAFTGLTGLTDNCRSFLALC